MELLLLGISPVITVADARVSAAWYVAHLGFEAMYVAEDGSYAVAGLQGQQVHLLRSESAEALAATRNHVMLRLRVRGLDGWWERLQASGPGTKMREPREEAWGSREFHVLDADGALVIVSEAGA